MQKLLNFTASNKRTWNLSKIKYQLTEKLKTSKTLPQSVYTDG